MKNSDRFLVAFNSIEIILKKYHNGDSYIPFSRLIQIARKDNATIRRYYDDIKEFSELRNAIVHNTVDVNYAIAEPHDHIVEKIESIEKELIQPKRVFALFQKKVLTFQSTSTLKDILLVINKYSYSKFPVYQEDQFLGLLTKKEIVNWLARQAYSLDSLSFSNTSLKKIIEHERNRKNYKFINKMMTIYEVKEIFKNIIEKDAPRIDALLITEHGKEDQALLGIITPWDIINME